MKALLVTCLIFILLALPPAQNLFAQPAGASRQTLPSIKDLPKTPFISEDGKFSVLLPPPDEKFIWRFKEGEIRLGFFDIAYYSNFLDREDFEYSVWLFDTHTLTGIPGKADEKLSKIDSQSQRATTFFNFDNGKFGIQKSLLVEKRFYTMLGIFDDKEAAKLFEQVFETFKVTGKVDFDAVFRKRIEEITPEALPQNPVAAGEKTDLADENLKGRVRKIVEAGQNSQNLKSKKRSIGKILEYDRRGYLLKETASNLGNPYSVTVYGFIDGKRVSRFGFKIENLSLFEPPPEPPAAAEVKRRIDPVYDSRYTSAYSKRYKNGKLIEKAYYDSSGRLTYRHVYQYKNNQMETRGYDNCGNLLMKNLSTFNKNGDIIETIDYNNELVDGYSKTAYRYVYDKTGNWIERTLLLGRRDLGEKVFIPQFTIFRTITYF